MTEKYDLNSETLPSVFIPHDCVIAQISISSEYVTFVFENDISYHDSIRFAYPKYKSLTIRYHLVDDTILVYKWKANRRNSKRSGYMVAETEDLKEWVKHGLEYISHYVSYNGMMIKLFSESEIIMELSTDIIEYEWN